VLFVSWNTKASALHLVWIPVVSQIPDFLSQEPISRSEQLLSALAMASILLLDGFSANFEYKISLTSPSVETGDRKMFSDVLI